MQSDVIARALEDSASRLSLIGEMAPQELHAFLHEYNWDDGLEPVRAIVRHPKCELATALLAFWLADPDLSTVPPAASRDQDYDAFVAEVFERINNGVYPVGGLPFDPDEFIANRLHHVKLERAGLPPIFMERLPNTGA